MARLRPLLLLAAALLAAPGGPADADVLVQRSGPTVRGVVVEQGDEEVVFNPYWSRNPEMVWGVIRLPARRVKRVEIEPHPAVEVFRRLAARAEGDTTALKEIAAYAKENKLKAHARMCLALALAEDAEDKEALAAIGGAAKLEAARAGNIHLDRDLRGKLAEYVETVDVEARKKAFAELKRMGLKARPEGLERHRLATGVTTGLQVDRPLSWGSDLFPGAVYTLFVPRAYDPVVPWPLIIGLHGGGAGGKKGDEVVGSGRSAMNFYRDLAARHGYIVACPDALHAPWRAAPNEEMLRALLEEMKHLYNIDVDRVYMTGHSMGGFGTWSLGPAMAEDLAAISPMAGGGGGGIGELVKTRTPIFIYHSDNDYVSVQSDRNAANRLRDTDLDFVYTELPGKGHSLPESIRVELFAFFGPRRRHDPSYKDVWPRSSLFGKVTKAEKRYLGDPLAAWKGDVEDLGDWIDHLRLGGGRADRAVARLAEAKPEGAAAAVAKVLKDARATFDARAWAARALGRLGDTAGVKALRKAVAGEAVRDQSRIAVEAARALAALQDADGGDALARGIASWVAYYEDKAAGGKIRYEDWARVVPTLAELVDAWGRLPGKGDARALERAVVARVLEPAHDVETSQRIPQDPSRSRAALAGAVARAFAAWDADELLRERLRESVKADPKAVAAVDAAR
jgi:dienelactone hydrolase